MKQLKKIIGFQLHYTSCRYGRSGQAGFQTRAMSSDIKPDEQRAVEPLGIYQPPRNTEAAQYFPKAYRNAYLGTGRLAIIKSAYVGQDYTRRLGNYFSHALIIKDRLPDDIWPVDLYEWDGWKDKLLPAEDTEDASFELPVVTLTPDKKAYAFTELQEFIKEESDRKNQFAYMIQAVFMRRETSRNVVIKDNETNGLFWIACLQKSFPPSHQKELDCSSYQFDPRACLAVNVTLGETDFVLGENERKYQFYVFDFVEGNHSQVGTLNEYATTVSTWMSTQPERLQDFYEFTRLFKHNSLNNELISLLHLFQLSINRVLGEKELVDVLDFVNSYTKPENFARILQIIGSADLTKSENPAILTHLIRFFIKSADSEYRLLSYQLIIRLFDNDGGLIEEINALRSEAKAAFGADEFSSLFLSAPHLSKITSNMLPPEKLSFAINELISSIRAAKVYEDDHFRQFVEQVVLANVPQRLEYLLTPFVDDPIAVASICVYISEIFAEQSEVSDESMKNLARFFSDKKYRFSIINTMKGSRSTWQILEEEWKYAIAKQRDKVAAHASYYQHVLQDESEFSQRYLPVFSAKLWDLLSKKDRLAQAIAWIRDKQTEPLAEELENTVFQTASEKVSFEPKDRQSDILYNMLVDQVNSRNIVLCPNRLVLRDAIIKLDVENFDFDKQPLNEIKAALVGVDNKTYKEFSQIYLPLILSCLTKKEQHGLVIKAVFCREHVDIFKQSYGLFFDKRSAKQFDDADMAALSFWLYLNDEDKETFQLIQASAIDWLLSHISAKLKDKAYSRGEIKKEKNTLFRSLWRKWRK
ncbi:hypothetical protein PN36_13175 [Candidatus Thiomargarita nelsonii]|uniref:Uncharacterized protein n=1 Tax=Candidatus Thiomargarita nelsonii TaxID=1003181 RepID=A0A0A6RVG6_9GAMM|nr:hypothetical protein PN36_13115 [Candidatus Thiomargarita nelsonii]TGO03081.1 hypothetical protein PN36_13175 [Candidatus Thiomargarita nelsonii]